MQKSHYLRRIWDTSQVQWLALGFLVAINSIPTSTGIGLALTKSALVVTWWTRNFEWFLMIPWMICNENFLGCLIGSEWCMMTCDDIWCFIVVFNHLWWFVMVGFWLVVEWFEIIYNIVYVIVGFRISHDFQAELELSDTDLSWVVRNYHDLQGLQ